MIQQENNKSPYIQYYALIFIFTHWLFFCGKEAFLKFISYFFGKFGKFTIFVSMNYKETQHEFIQLWGSLGTNWGINKAMAQIHALLLSVENPISTDEIMEELKFSRSNTNLNVRALMDWGLVYKKHILGDRKEYFVAEKDMWEVAFKIIRERRRREIEPVGKELKELAGFSATTFEEKNFKLVLENITEVTEKLNSFAGTLEKLDKLNIMKWLIKS